MKECKTKYSTNTFHSLGTLFEKIPISTRVENSIFVVHGGILDSKVPSLFAVPTACFIFWCLF